MLANLLSNVLGGIVIVNSGVMWRRGRWSVLVLVQIVERAARATTPTILIESASLVLVPHTVGPFFVIILTIVAPAAGSASAPKLPASLNVPTIPAIPPIRRRRVPSVPPEVALLPLAIPCRLVFLAVALSPSPVVLMVPTAVAGPARAPAMITHVGPAFLPAHMEHFTVDEHRGGLRLRIGRSRKGAWALVWGL